MRADRIKVGDVLAGFPNRTVTAAESVTEPGWPKPWIRITTTLGTSPAVPPDYPFTIQDRDVPDDLSDL